MSTTAIDPLATRTVLDRVGGVRGMIDGGLPPLVFVVLNTAARISMAPADAVRLALAGALVTGAVIIVVRRTRAQTVVQAMRGLAGLAVAALFAVFSGQARDFFLPGMVVDAAYAVAFAVSALIGRPLVGALYRLLSGRRIPWRDEPAMRRVFAVATVGWALVYAVRAGVQIVFYRDDHPTLLAVSKLVLGWPLTALAVVLTLAYLRRALATTGAPPPSGYHRPPPRQAVRTRRSPSATGSSEVGSSWSRALNPAGVVVHPRAVGATESTVTFDDGTFVHPVAVAWATGYRLPATGYRHDDRWITIPGALDAAGTLRSDGADSPVRGLHVIGRPWQRDRGSSLLGFVQHDARRLAVRLVAAAAVGSGDGHGHGHGHGRSRSHVS